MKKIEIVTSVKKILSDIYTPVGIYLRLRDRYRDTVLLESAAHQQETESYSVIGINAIAGFELKANHVLEIKFPCTEMQSVKLTHQVRIEDELSSYMQHYRFSAAQSVAPVQYAQSLFGYTCYDAVQYFESVSFTTKHNDVSIPLIRYRLYQYVIIINHLKDEMYCCENQVNGLSSEFATVEALIKGRNIPLYPFKAIGEETSSVANETFINMVNAGIRHCLRGDCFQVVLSRRFSRRFTGDDFNVYRALRSINPSPYLFYFDYGDYQLMGSSPEAQLIVKDNTAVVHPIAGTFKRTGNAVEDALLADRLLNDAKENAEHVMLVDLARNDLSKCCSSVEISVYKQVKYFSHVMHLVSEVKAQIDADVNRYALLQAVFPAGTLSGAPKYRAMQIIDEQEPVSRSFYGGCIGVLGFNGDIHHAIMIRTFLSKNNVLHYQAGAGVVAASNPISELQEVNNKLSALKQAIEIAETLNQ